MSKSKKQISFVSAIVIVIGSVIGAGIFFKNRSLFSLSQGDLSFVIGTWTIAGFGIVCLALALIEISSRSKTNTGILEWTKNFMPSLASESTKNFMVLFFLPVTVVAMPFFAVDSWQAAGLPLNDIWVLVLALSLGVYLLIVNMLSLRFSEISQWFFTAIQMIPLIVIPIIAFSLPLSSQEIWQKTVGNGDLQVSRPSGLSGQAPAMVMLTGIPAIMFAFDGFYEASSIRKNMKNPRNNTKAIITALLIILSIYIFITVAFGIGSKEGSIKGIFNRTPAWVNALFNILISVGVVSTVNGYILASISQFQDLIDRNESMILIKSKGLLQKLGLKNKTNRFYAFFYLFIVYVTLNLIVWTVGTYVWTGGSPKKYNNNDFYIYSFINVITNYNSLLIYFAISGSVFGGLINRKTKRLEVSKSKLFIPTAIFSCLFVVTGLIYTFVAGIVDSTGFNGANKLDASIKLIIVIGFIVVSVSLGYYERGWLKRYHKKIRHKPERWELELIRQNKIYLERKKCKKKVK